VYAPFLIDRPKELATDDSPVIDTIKHSLDVTQEQTNSGFDAVVLLQPTSPNRTVVDIVSCVSMFDEQGSKHGVVSGYQFRHKKSGKLDGKKNAVTFQRSGAVFVIPTTNIKNNLILTGAEFEYCTSKSNSGDIDTMDDWKECDAIMRYRKMEGEE
jgi:N-acylneuraminate cytidylyltransferase